MQVSKSRFGNDRVRVLNDEEEKSIYPQGQPQRQRQRRRGGGIYRTIQRYDSPTRPAQTSHEEQEDKAQSVSQVSR